MPSVPHSEQQSRSGMQEPSGHRRVPRIIGAALFTGISVAALRVSEVEEIARLAERARPWWPGA